MYGPERVDILNTKLGQTSILAIDTGTLFGHNASQPNGNSISIQVEMAAKPAQKAKEQLTQVCGLLAASLHGRRCNL